MIRHEYAGFVYDIVTDEAGRAIRAIPLPGQHPAGAKDKHRRAAIATFNEETDR